MATKQLDFFSWGIFLLAALAVAGVGFIDDINSISPRYRILVHAFAAILISFSIGTPPPFLIFGYEIILGNLGSVLIVIVVIWMINLYNFMDGIDGLASVEAVTVCLSAYLVMFWRGNIGVELTLLLILTSSVLGFMVWNWPPAKIFMGDSCSGFLGLVFAVMAIVTSIKGLCSLWMWIVLMGVFIVDTSYTLCRRIMTGEVWYAAHKTHTYQILAEYFGSHKIVTISALCVNSFWLFPLAICVENYQFYAPIITLIALTPLFVFAHYLGLEKVSKKMLS